MFEKLTATELERVQATASFPEYFEFVSDLRTGQGGRVDVAKAGVSRQTVKNRVQRSAEAAGAEIRFIRSGMDSVVFEVVGKA